MLMASLVAWSLLGACSEQIQRSRPITVKPQALTSAEPGMEIEGPMPEKSPTVIQTAGEFEATDGSFRADEEVRMIGEDGDLVDERIIVNELPVGMPYPVDGLVGQINGRPVFADEFLLPLEDRILRIVAELPVPKAMAEVDRLVSDRFRQYVDSELIIAEAESRLTVAEQRGIFGWLKSVQEDAIVGRGGTRDSATESIEEEFGIGLEEFVEQRKTVVLANQLLETRVRPRAIVSWRDVEQAYRRDYAKFNPPTRVSLGRLRLHQQRQADQVAEAKKLFGEGLGFEATLERIEPGSSGEWLDLELPEDGIAGTSLASAVKERLDPERPDTVGEPLVQGAFISWFTVLGVEKPPGRSIYDAGVQLGLENELSILRMRQEQDRYLATLKDRWVAGDIIQMRDRLAIIARIRYFSAR